MVLRTNKFNVSVNEEDDGQYSDADSQKLCDICNKIIAEVRVIKVRGGSNVGVYCSHGCCRKDKR